MAVKSYGPGDIVFAKVRGYPPWPARVEAVADETPNKMRFHVYFYGTGETAVCKADELYPYKEHRHKFGKPMKKKGFNEAVKQVDAELGLSPVSGQSRVSEGTDSELDATDETPSKLPRGRPSLVKTVLQKQNTPKRVHWKDSPEVSGDEPESKKARSVNGSPKVQYEAVSRSGRKIKPRKFADEGAEDSVSPEGNNEVVSPAAKQSPGKGGRKSSGDSSTTDSKEGSVSSLDSAEANVVLDAEFLNNGELVAWTPGGQEVKVKLNLKRPATFKNEKARIQWEASVIKDGKELKAKIESGECIPEVVKKEFEEKYHARVLQIEQNKKNLMLDDKKEKLAYLKAETQLLDLDVRIKTSLGLKHANPEACLHTLDELLELKLNPLMLKKHPEVVETIKKMRKYVGNIAAWNMSEEEKQVFMLKAANIRAKAEHVYNKMKSMFLVPYDKSFWDVFADELKEFNKKTECLASEERYHLTVDPTNVNKENVDESTNKPADG